MANSSKVDKFIDSVCQEIRWKKAHNMVSREIKDHIIDQRDAYLNQGLDENGAISKAIEEMGDPALIGAELNQVHRPKIEWGIFILTGMMLIFGLTISYLADYERSMPFMFSRSLFTTMIGLVLMIGVYFLDFSKMIKYSWFMFLGLTLLSVSLLPLTPIIRNVQVYVQYILLLYPLLMVAMIYDLRNKGYLGIIKLGILFLVPIFLGLYISSISVVIIITTSFFFTMRLSIKSGWFKVNKLYGSLLLYLPIIVIVGKSFLKLIVDGHNLDRLYGIIDPARDEMGRGYIAIKVRGLLSDSRLIGEGRLKIDSPILPEINTNYILTYIIHRLGWLVFILLIFLILVFLIRSFKVSSQQRSKLSKLASTAILSIFIMEVLLYIISNLGIPISSFVLPFISYGGMGTIVNMFLVGIMLSIFRSKNIDGTVI